MNKLVIIGNGFDLAHGLNTRYSDFLLWKINEAFKQKSYHIQSPLFEIESSFNICDQNYKPFQFSKIIDFLKFKKEQEGNIKFSYSYQFISYLFDFKGDNWVDVEKEYYDFLVQLYELYNKNNNYDYTEELNDLY